MQTWEKDTIAWANEQAELLRAGHFEKLDIEHIAEEIEDVGRSEQRELASRMAKLLAHLLEWTLQPGRRGASWQRTIKAQRDVIIRRLARTPSLRPMLSDKDWNLDMWEDAVALAATETGLGDLPESCPWSFQEQVLHEDWLPD